MAARCEPGPGAALMGEPEQESPRPEPAFVYTEADLFRSGIRWDGERPDSRFDQALRSAWERRMRAGCFRYRLWGPELPARELPGPRRLLAQLNVRRATERRPPQEILSVRQPFDPQRFNFSRVPHREILFPLRRSPSAEAAAPGGGPREPGGGPGGDAEALLIINVSPLEYGHVLLLPEPGRLLPQCLTRASVLRALELVFLSSEPAFRVGFNSLGAFASVNHLHLHGFYLRHRLELERAPTEPLAEAGLGARVHRLCGHHTRGLVLYSDGGERDRARVADALLAVSDLLLRRSLAHNLLLSRGCPLGRRPPQPDGRDGVRLVLWPRRSCFGAKDGAAFNVAVCELAGFLPVHTAPHFESLTEEAALRVIGEQLLPAQRFSELCAEIAGLPGH
ncbi:GDP-D-glucose phosphorylase 1 [Pristis pectinata]|uniref:GDP-D-glucose phosphorylase 1 n=1 Tax=Pristis pectinata TaxID=685728 RepID=UPI00223E28DC|nr:GDP-D-glucose phosphorylase 1 [Pristis pectinata]